MNTKESFVELENLLTKECEKYEKDCAACPYAKECEEYKNLYMELPADETGHKPGDIITYGYNDQENAIKCVYYYSYKKEGELIIYAACEGGSIQAPAYMFK